ncbi:kelch-like protein 26 [Amphiura filiformis]|uniref:kelch-like protein 26 n=1 Tax=Amphiura filiformis TaxID=82378 RepID=UPI003B214134
MDHAEVETNVEHIGLMLKRLKKIDDVCNRSKSEVLQVLQETLWQLEYSHGVLQGLKRLQSDATLSDVTIKVDGKVFHGHRCVLASASGYFEAMFATGFQESEVKEIELQDMDADIFKLIFNFMYSGKMELSTDTAVPAFYEATYLELRNAERPFVTYFRKALPKKELTVTHNEMLSLREVAENHHMPNLQWEFYKQLIDEFQEVVISDLFVEKAPSDLILEYLDNIPPDSDVTEEQLFSQIIHWLKYDWENRKGCAHKCLSRLRLGLIPKDKVQELIDDQILEIPECKEMMDDMIKKWTEFEGVDDYMILPVAFLPRNMIRTLVAFGGQRETRNDSEKFGHYFDHENRLWAPLNVTPEMPGENFELLYPSMVVVGRDIYLAGGRCRNDINDSRYTDAYESQRCFKLDGNSCRWIELPLMEDGRMHFDLVHHNGFLYAIGGATYNYSEENGLEGPFSLDSVERFNISQQTWDHTYKLPEPMLYTSAAVVDGKILVYGMTRCVDRVGEYTLVGFDPVTQEWSKFLQERYSIRSDVPDCMLVVQDGACYRVRYEVTYRNVHGVGGYLFPTNDRMCVNHIEIHTETSEGRGDVCTVSIGREIEHQNVIRSYTDGNTFHIDGHVYINVCRLALRTGVVVDPNDLDVRNRYSDLNGWTYCSGSMYKYVVKYTFDSNKMK